MNRLAGEDSLYLRQHAASPVDWYPWAHEAFAEAAGRDVPVLLSVGYASCHWCHVMAREVFDDPETARLLDASLVCVKVDRDERPEIDLIYMKALRAMTGGAGWPMTLLLLPDRRPFFAATYLTRDALRELVRGTVADWRGRRDDVVRRAEQLSAAVTARNRAVPRPARPASTPPDSATFEAEAVAWLKGRFDPVWGGFDRGPKFPRPPALELLLSASRQPDALPMLVTTLDAMASGGIYDHLGGGFARYATDHAWRAPHFEKLLPDNAQLARTYLHAWKLTGADRYRQVAEETLGYLAASPVRVPGAGFASGEDADSGGGEGRYYRWSQAEALAAGGEQAAAWFGVTEPEQNILCRPERGRLSRPPEIEAARQRMVAVRARREHPAVDDRLITEWNAMAIAALAEAGAALGRADWLDLASCVGRFLLGHLRRPDGRWLRAWRAGRARQLAGATDYAWLIEAFTRLAEATGDPAWASAARDAADGLLDLFTDHETGGVWATGKDADTPVTRLKSVGDGVAPSATGMSAWVLARLSALTDDERYRQPAAEIVAGATPLLRRNPGRMATLTAAAGLLSQELAKVTIPSDRPDLAAVIHRRHLPAVVLGRGGAGGGAVVCHRNTCLPPASDPAVLERLLARHDQTTSQGR